VIVEFAIPSCNIQTKNQTYLNSGQVGSTVTLNWPSVRASDLTTDPPNSLTIIYNNGTICQLSVTIMLHNLPI